MKYTKSFIKTKKETPRGATSFNQAFLERGSFIYQVGSGIFAFQPLGFKVYEKIIQIIREELNNIGVQEVFLPVLHPSEFWKTSGRFTEIGDELLKVNTSKEAEFVLAMTHEEIITPLAKTKIQSFTDLPFVLNQFSKKIRYEARPRGGLIRLRDFNMQDAYSFDANEEQLDKIFNDFARAYKKIFERIGIKAIMVEASSGMMGGKDSREFMLITPVGEDRVLTCECGKAYNAEVVLEGNKCVCGKDLKEEKGIELAHIFKLRDRYSSKFDLNFTNDKGESKPVLMGCYGIGIDRLIAAVVEEFHDEAGIIWPKAVAPVDVYLIDLEGSKGEEVYKKLTDAGIDVLFDDREVAAGVKFADADLLGIPYRVVISEKTLKEDSVEIKERWTGKEELTNIDSMVSKLR